MESKGRREGVRGRSDEVRGIISTLPRASASRHGLSDGPSNPIGPPCTVSVRGFEGRRDGEGSVAGSADGEAGTGGVSTGDGGRDAAGAAAEDRDG
jgi:hypothetical protein